HYSGWRGERRRYLSARLLPVRLDFQEIQNPNLPVLAGVRSGPGLTLMSGLEHPRKVLTRLSRFAAITMVLVLLGGHLAECQGWLSTPEARMACCANEQECPMHNAGQHSSASNHRISQSDADRCCATSERGESTPTSVKPNAVESPASIPTT